MRVAMIGGGINSAVGRVHEIALKMDGEFELVAGCFSRNHDINHDSGKIYGIEASRIYQSAEHLINAECCLIDAVVIATPINSHADYINLALDRGLVVICDKPILPNVEQCRSLIDRLSLQNTQVFSIFNYTGYPAVREMRERIAQGELGQLFKIMVEMPQDSYMRLKNQQKHSAIQEWRLHDGEISCVSLDLFVHLHSLIHFVCPETPQRVTAWSRAISNVALGLIDEVDAIIEYSNNLIVNAWYGKAALGYRNGLRIRVQGTNGSLAWHQEEPELLHMSDELGNRMTLDRIDTTSSVTSQGRYQRFKAGHPSGFIEAFANYYADIARAMRQGELNAYTLSMDVAMQGLELAHAITQSSKQHRSIDLNTDK